MNYQTYSNQQIINAFYYAVRKLNANGSNYDAWDLIVDAHLQHMVEQRHAHYNGTSIDLLPLAVEVIKAIVAELKAMTPELADATVATMDHLLPVPWISQLDNISTEGADCGQACVLMLLKYYDTPPSPEILSNTSVNDLVELMRNIDVAHGRPRRAKNYTSADDLVQLAESNGLKLTADKGFRNLNTALDLLEARRPVIVLVDYLDLQFPIHLNDGANQGLHWLTIVGSSGGGSSFTVHDPLWSPALRNRRGGSNLSISRSTLENALRLHLAVY